MGEALRFVDLVRNFTNTDGQGNFVLGDAVPGFSGFQEAVQTGDCFYYMAISIDNPEEREVGRGQLQADGTISRQPVVLDAPFNFSSGEKSIALVAAADWFDKP